MSQLDDVQAQATELAATVSSQGETIGLVRGYVSNIEAQLAELLSGELLPAAAALKVQGISDTLAAARAALDANAAGLAAAGDGDRTT